MTGTLCKKQAAKVGSMEWQWRHHLHRPKLIHQDLHTEFQRCLFVRSSKSQIKPNTLREW